MLHHNGNYLYLIMFSMASFYIKRLLLLTEQSVQIKYILLIHFSITPLCCSCGIC